MRVWFQTLVAWLSSLARRLHPHLHPHLPAVRRGVALVVLAVVGSGIGAALTPPTAVQVGPLQTQVRVLPSVHPGVELLLPPVGEVHFSTYWAPIVVQARISQVDADEAQAYLDSPSRLSTLVEQAPEVIRSATIDAAIRTGVGMLVGAVALSLLAYRRVWVRTAEVALVVVMVMVAVVGLTASTFDADRLAQPRFTGLLSRAPYVAGTAPSVLARLESYRSGLSDIVRSVTTLYATAGDLPALGQSKDDVVTLLHISDNHLNPLAYDLVDRLVPQFGVDVVLDTGDITTWGTDLEATTLSRIRGVKVPYVFVRGNHDSAATAAAVAANPNAIVLEDRVVQVAGLTIAGIGDPQFTPDETGGSATPTVTSPPPTLASPNSSATTSAAAPTPSPTPTPVPESVAQMVQRANNERLLVTIDDWRAAHPDVAVDIAAVHEPTGLEPLLGQVPTVMAGHTHKRQVSVKDGTRIMIEGSTGGAGITSSGLNRLTAGEPLPLAATLVYLARSGPRAGQVVAYDEITVGGFGLASVSLQRHVVRPEDDPVTPIPAVTP